jgi:hypothetical protein
MHAAAQIQSSRRIFVRARWFVEFLENIFGNYFPGDASRDTSRPYETIVGHGKMINDTNDSTEPDKHEFVIAGDSHIHAMGAPRGYAGPASLIPIETIRGRGYFLVETWKGGRKASYWNALEQHSKGRIVVLFVMGNQHFGHFLLARRPLFDFVDPMDPAQALYPGAVVVPRRMVKALRVLNTKWLRDMVLQLRVGGCRHIFLGGTPPVREDFGDAREEGVIKSEYFLEMAKRMGVDIATCPLTPAPIMKRLWGVLQEALMDVARETGARFVPVPAAAIDANGYLSIQYRGPLSNFTHANDAYGRLMLDEIVHAVNESAMESVSPPGESSRV